MRKKFKTASMDEDTAQMLTFLSKITNSSKTSFLKQILSQLLIVGSVFKEGTILQFETSALCSSVTITFVGKSRLSIGGMPDRGQSDSEVEEIIKKDVEEK